MIVKKIYGSPIETYSVINKVTEIKEQSLFSELISDSTITFKYKLNKDDIIYGMGETMNGMNKRPGRYISFNTDNTNHHDGVCSLYGTHNFFIVDGIDHFGVFVDTPSRSIFDFDYNDSGIIEITCETKDLNLYIISGDDSYSITKEFLLNIGKSFIPPLYSLGYIQSRWGYTNEEDFKNVLKGYRDLNIPLDGICMDIDYMDSYIDFTVNKNRFPDLKKLVNDFKNDGCHLIPIIDAGIKAKKGEPTSDEGVKLDYFCKDTNNKLFKGYVWPGACYFTNFLNSDARKWFGSKFKNITDYGIDGFWIDMNEPAIFFIKKKFSLKNLFIKKEKIESMVDQSKKVFEYKSFYQELDGKKYLHYDIHNMYGHTMQIASGEGLNNILNTRYLLFSRSSYVGSHRYGGIWTGDNRATWNHLRRNLTQMVGLNMVGLLYSGADTGGFIGGIQNRELLLRWMMLSIFTPLFRNHATRTACKKECYNFDKPDDFRNIINLRYRLIPYIYSEYVKAALNNDMYIKPLSFIYKDKDSRLIEDQLLVGDSIMIAPIIDEGKTLRDVYLPEDMIEVRFDGYKFNETNVKKGYTTLKCNLDEVVFYIRNNKLVPISKLVQSTKDIDLYNVELLGNGHEYKQYIDDGYTKDVTLNNIRTLTK